MTAAAATMMTVMTMMTMMMMDFKWQYTRTHVVCASCVNECETVIVRRHKNGNAYASTVDTYQVRTVLER